MPQLCPPSSRDRKLGRDPKDIVKLDANENPYGPPPEVTQALGSMPFPNIYPDPETRRLREALAEREGLPKEHILVSYPMVPGRRRRRRGALLVAQGSGEIPRFFRLGRPGVARTS